MDDAIYACLLDDATLFAPTGGHRAIEIRSDGVGGEPQIAERALAERQVASWCRETQGTPGASTFRLLVCSPRVLDRDIWPLPVSSGTLRSVMETLAVPPLFPRTMCRHIPLAGAFDSFHGDCNDTAESGSDGRFGILLRTNLSHTWQYALALVHDPAANATTGILFGLRHDEIEDVLRSVRRAARSVASCPAVLPCVLMDKALDALVRDAEDRRRSLTQIRIETGSHGFRRASTTPARPTPTRDQWDDMLEDLDLNELMQKLTSLSDACAGMAAVCRIQHDFIETISAFRERVSHHPGYQPPTTSSAGVERHAVLPAGTRYAAQQLRFFVLFLRGVESKVAYTRSSVQDQVQAIYSLINQREARSQVELARTSRRLAELSRRDSTDMRVISAVTLVFLPATFTSTFFSTSFFDFQPSSDGSGGGSGGGGRRRVVSDWVWLYWAVTAVLTAAVLGLWWFFSRRQNAKALAEFRRQSEIRMRGEAESKRARLEMVETEMLGRMETFRPYLGGSIAEGMFARKGKLAL